MSFLRAFRRAAGAAGATAASGAPAAAGAGQRAEPSIRETAAPPLTLIVPMRGLDPGLEANLEAFLEQDYTDYQAIFVTDREDDPSIAVAQRVASRSPDRRSRILVAGPARERGQKIHNLLCALDVVPERDRVVVFGDSDIRPGPDWLRDLVAPLADPNVGASTGFRWHVPVEGGAGSVLRSVWNAGIASLMTGERPPFAWGGALAIRRETYDAAGIRDRWRGALSDDYVVTRAVEELGLTIRFEPRCLGFTHADCSMRELLDWSFRQLAITRVYRPILWRVGLAGEAFGNLTFWGGLFVLAAAGLSVAGFFPPGFPEPPPTAGVATSPGFDPRPLVLALLLVSAWAARGWKAWMRLRGVSVLFPDIGARLRQWRAAYLFGTPLCALISLSAFLRSAVTREISWRGIRYRMVSASRTEILG